MCVLMCSHTIYGNRGSDLTDVCLSDISYCRLLLCRCPSFASCQTWKCSLSGVKADGGGAVAVVVVVHIHTSLTAQTILGV